MTSSFRDFLLLLLPAAFLCASPLMAQNDWYDAGGKVFKLSCAQGYCHGSGGTQGRAPKLIGQAYEAAQVRKIIENGVPGTGMPGFAQRLTGEQMTAVLFYVVRISGGDTSSIAARPGGGGGSSADARQQMPVEASRGKALFFDALKGVHRCSTCHALEDIGLAVGPNLTSLGPLDAAAIRAGKDAVVRMAVAGAESFPALAASQKAGLMRVYDLTVAPPVLRTFRVGEVRLSGGAQWKHATATQAYSESELGAVAAYLKWMAER